MREGSSRAGKGCEARERANRGPCFTNCHLRGANGGTGGAGMGGGQKIYNCRPAPDCTQREMYSGTCKHCIMHTQVNIHTHTQTNTNTPGTGRRRARAL